MTMSDPPLSPRDDASRSNGPYDPGATAAAHAAADHTVQFYESRDFLYDSVARYIADGLKDGQPAVVFATDALRGALTGRLEESGVDVEHARRTGSLTLVDAHEALTRLMAGRMPDEQRFDAIVGRSLRRSLGGRTDASVRVHGEMVEVLWRDGNAAGALRLEDLWNELAERVPLSLLCTYAMSHFHGEAETQRFREVCHRHGRIVPVESYAPAGAEDRGRKISLLQQRARSLEAEIERREWLEAALREAKNEAEEASRAKSDFLAVVSHEFRTPLNAIMGYRDLLKEGVGGSLNAQQRSYLDRIDSAAKQLLGLIDQILNLSRIEAGAHTVRTGPVDVGALVGETLAMVAPSARDKGLTLEVEAPEHPMVCETDPDKLRQILLNLLSNAVKFTEEGGIELRLSSWKDRVMIAVRDTGVGIPPAELDEVFGLFARGAAAGSLRVDGTGLGLPVSRELAELLGGELSAESTPARGSVFTLRLPVRWEGPGRVESPSAESVPVG